MSGAHGTGEGRPGTDGGQRMGKESARTASGGGRRTGEAGPCYGPVAGLPAVARLRLR